MVLAAKTFTPADQQCFARLSGDVNPMHMDAAAARRTQMGAPVTHGVHGVLWALDALAAAETLPPIAGLKVNFTGPIYVGDAAEASIGRRTDAQLRVQIAVDGTAATSIVLSFGPARAAAPGDGQPPMAPWPAAPLAPDLADMAAQAGGFAFADEAGAAEAFPALAQTIGAQRVAAIAALSSVVGMACPGLHSIFNGLSVVFVDGGPAGGIGFRASDVDERFRLLRVAIAGGGIEGELEAFARTPPVAQPTMAEVAAVVPAGAYAGAVALVVGGSRGLGEVAAKALAAGGARVIVTYAVGRAEAGAVAGEIRAAGARCDAIALDVLGDVRAQLEALPAAPSHLYYFATGPIAMRRTRLVSPEVLDRFMRFYCTGFLAVCEALATGAPGGRLSVFYPSSTAVEDTPKGWTEYAMAKAAAEVLCRDMGRHLPGVRVIARRLPRILTDQTATVRPVDAAPVLEVIPAIVAELQN